MSALVKGPQCLQSTGNTSLEPFDDTRSHVTVTRYILPHSVTLSRLARLSILGRLAEVSLVLSRGHAWDMCHQRNIGNYESTPRIRMICGAHLQEVWAEINIRQVVQRANSIASLLVAFFSIQFVRHVSIQIFTMCHLC